MVDLSEDDIIGRSRFEKPVMLISDIMIYRIHERGASN